MNSLIKPIYISYKVYDAFIIDIVEHMEMHRASCGVPKCQFEERHLTKELAIASLRDHMRTAHPPLFTVFGRIRPNSLPTRSGILLMNQLLSNVKNA